MYVVRSSITFAIAPESQPVFERSWRPKKQLNKTDSSVLSGQKKATWCRLFHAAWLYHPAAVSKQDLLNIALQEQSFGGLQLVEAHSIGKNLLLAVFFLRLAHALDLRGSREFHFVIVRLYHELECESKLFTRITQTLLGFQLSAGDTDIRKHHCTRNRYVRVKGVRSNTRQRYANA